MPTTSVVGEIGAIRKRDVDAAVNARINRAGGYCTVEQMNTWEAEAYREWRRRWPLLNNLLIDHEPVGDDDGSPVPYDRDVLVNVLVYHWRAGIKGCGCGWAELGRSWPEHVATIYEESIRART